MTLSDPKPGFKVIFDLYVYTYKSNISKTMRFRDKVTEETNRKP